jgi:hypothetical protein
VSRILARSHHGTLSPCQNLPRRRSRPSSLQSSSHSQVHDRRRSPNSNFHRRTLGIHPLILGMPWLETVNPDIDWRLKSVKTCTGNILSSPQSTPEPVPEPNLESTPKSSPEPQSKSKSKSARRKKTRRGPLPREPKPIPERPKILLTRRIDPEDQVYLLHADTFVTLSDCLSTLAPAQGSNPPEIPKEYCDLSEVFSKSKAHELPPHRDHLDHHIPLEDGAKPVFGPIYSMRHVNPATKKRGNRVVSTKNKRTRR